MENWIKEAKETAKFEAEYFIESINNTAEKNHLDKEWFLDEVLLSIHRLKK